MAVLVISRVLFRQKNLFYLWEISKYQKTYKYTKTSKIIPLELPKWLKMHHECRKYPKTYKMTKTPQKRPQWPRKLIKWPKYNWNLKNKQKTRESSKNDKNTPKLSQNTLNFLDFGDTLVGFELCCSSLRILGHFAHFSNVEVYFLIIFYFWSNLVIYELSRFDCSF